MSSYHELYIIPYYRSIHRYYCLLVNNPSKPELYLQYGRPSHPDVIIQTHHNLYRSQNIPNTIDTKLNGLKRRFDSIIEIV